VLLARVVVVFTPHNAFKSHEALVRILSTTLANLEAYRAGQRLIASPESPRSRCLEAEGRKLEG